MEPSEQFFSDGCKPKHGYLLFLWVCSQFLWVCSALSTPTWPQRGATEERGDGIAVKGEIEVQVEVELLGANGEDADDRPNGVIGLDAVGIPEGDDILEAQGTGRDPKDTGNDPEDTFCDRLVFRISVVQVPNPTDPERQTTELAPEASVG